LRGKEYLEDTHLDEKYKDWNTEYEDQDKFERILIKLEQTRGKRLLERDLLSLKEELRNADREEKCKNWINKSLAEDLLSLSNGTAIVDYIKSSSDLREAFTNELIYKIKQNILQDTHSNIRLPEKLKNTLDIQIWYESNFLTPNSYKYSDYPRTFNYVLENGLYKELFEAPKIPINYVSYRLSMQMKGGIYKFGLEKLLVKLFRRYPTSFYLHNPIYLYCTSLELMEPFIDKLYGVNKDVFFEKSNLYPEGASVMAVLGNAIFRQDSGAISKRTVEFIQCFSKYALEDMRMGFLNIVHLDELRNMYRLTLEYSESDMFLTNVVNRVVNNALEIIRDYGRTQEYRLDALFLYKEIERDGLLPEEYEKEILPNL
jgi:hypothetical protein